MVPDRTRPGPDPLARRQPALDGLRGAAAAAVVIFHLGYVRGGWLAVDAFFTLSGFLITSLLLREHGRHDGIGLRAFWVRRARRLLPALGLCLALVAVVAVLTGTVTSVLQRQTLGSGFYVANWVAVVSPQSYWELFTGRSPLEHTWSLAIEEQFYVVWPLLCAGALALAARRSRRRGDGALTAAGAARVVGVVAAVGLVASMVAMLAFYEPGGDTNRVYFGTDTRVASILVGVLLACLLRARPQHVPARSDAEAVTGWAGLRHLPPARQAGRVALEVGAALAAVGLLVAWWQVEGTTPAVYRGGLWLHAGATALIIAAALHPVRGPISRLLSARPLVGLGVISYGVYLFHWPIICWLTPERTGLDGVVLAGVQIVATLAVALASWAVIERPVLRGGVPLRAVLGGVAVAVAVSAVAVMVAPVEAPAGSTELAAGGFAPGEQPVHFDLPAPPPSAPVAGFPPAMPAYRVLFIGDSVPYSIAKNWQPDPNEVAVGNLAIPSCDGARGGRIHLPLNQYFNDRPECQSWDTLWPDAFALFQPDAVAVMLGMAAVQDRQVDGVWTRPCDPYFDNWYAGQVDQRLSFIEAHTGAVVLLALSPYGEDRTIGVLPADHRHRTDCLNHTYRTVVERHPRVQLIDFGGWVCPGGTCRTELDGQPMRPDGLHFSPPAAAAAGAWIVEQGKLVGLARATQAAAPPQASPDPSAASDSSSTSDPAATPAAAPTTEADAGAGQGPADGVSAPTASTSGTPPPPG